MCLSPLHIKSNIVYNTAGYTPRWFDVPCGKCLECKEVYMQEWQTRLSFHIHSLYKRGGLAVMLTFTYNDESLPWYHDSSCDFHFPCFDHSHVLGFLNRLKAACWRRYGRGSYTYFLTSEYGKDTQRPHYHAIFFLSHKYLIGLNSVSYAVNFGCVVLCSLNMMKSVIVTLILMVFPLHLFFALSLVVRNMLQNMSQRICRILITPLSLLILLTSIIKSV